MPILKSAIKKVRKDKLRTVRNKKRELELKSLIKKVRKDHSKENLKAVFSALDKAVKVNLIHKNKASRLKSRLSKGITGSVKSVNKPTTESPRKKSTKKV